MRAEEMTGVGARGRKGIGEELGVRVGMDDLGISLGEGRVEGRRCRRAVRDFAKVLVERRARRVVPAAALLPLVLLADPDHLPLQASAHLVAAPTFLAQRAEPLPPHLLDGFDRRIAQERIVSGYADTQTGPPRYGGNRGIWRIGRDILPFVPQLRSEGELKGGEGWTTMDVDSEAFEERRRLDSWG